MMPRKIDHAEYRRKNKQKKRAKPESREVENARNRAFRAKHHYGVRGTKKRWTEDEENLVLNWVAEDRLLAKKLGRSLAGIQAKRAALVATGREMIERPHHNGQEIFEEGMVEVGIYMSHDHYEFAKRAGYGNASKGVRMALDREMRRRDEKDCI